MRKRRNIVGKTNERNRKRDVEMENGTKNKQTNSNKNNKEKKKKKLMKSETVTTVNMKATLQFVVYHPFQYQSIRMQNNNGTYNKSHNFFSTSVN